jgi:hypothetical protein
MGGKEKRAENGKVRRGREWEVRRGKSTHVYVGIVNFSLLV